MESEVEIDDQTLPEWLRDRTRNAQGSAIFLVSDGGRLSLEYEDSLTHEQTVARASAKSSFAVKWVPHDVATMSDIQATACPHRGLPCFKSCRAGVGCFCINGKCGP